MNRQRSRRSVVGVHRARRIRPARPAGHSASPGRRPLPVPGADEAALAFLADILVGDRAWTLAEVQRLISMRESAELGR